MSLKANACRHERHSEDTAYEFAQQSLLPRHQPQKLLQWSQRVRAAEPRAELCPRLYPPGRRAAKELGQSVGGALCNRMKIRGAVQESRPPIGDPTAEYNHLHQSASPYPAGMVGG